MKIQRIQLATLTNTVQAGKATIVYGPRQAGKTTLVKEYLSTYTGKYLFLNADEVATRELLSTQSSHVLAGVVQDLDLLVIDEAQRVPDIGLSLKIMIDSFPELAIIATGSASFDLATKLNEPLTGRKSTLTLYPISFEELATSLSPFSAQQLLERWLIWGGYPEAVTLESLERRTAQLNELVGSYLYKDILELDGLRRADKIVDLLRLLAFQIGKDVSVTELASSLSLNRDTVEKYLDLLEKVFVIFRVQSFSRNLRKAIAKNHRYYFFDTGVRNSLIQNFNPLHLRDDVGQLWENYLVAERRKANHYHQRAVNSYFWRTYDQKEIDIIEESAGRISGYECKWQPTSLSAATTAAFTSAFPEATLSSIDSHNFPPFLLTPKHGKITE